MALTEWVRHALPLKLKDGKRHLFPTLASMVYKPDEANPDEFIPIVDENGKLVVDDAAKLAGKDASHYENKITSITANGAMVEPDEHGNVNLGNMQTGASVELDDTLKVEGKAADAKATGDAIDQLSQQITEQKESISDSWTSGKTYAARDYVIYGNRLYKCKIAHTAGDTFDATYWETVSLSEELNAVDKKLFVKQKTTGPDGIASITLKTTISKRVLFFFGVANNFPCTGVVYARYEYERSVYAMLRQFNYLEGEDVFTILECSVDGDVVTIKMPAYGVYNFMATYEIE